MTGQESWPQTPGELHLFTYYCLGMAAGWSRERCEQVARWAWPLAYFKIHGIERGRQWQVLGHLAARYARDFTADELAHELWEVVQASEQNPRNPWRWHQIRDCAARAKRFIGRADARQAQQLSQARDWLGGRQDERAAASWQRNGVSR